MIIVEDSEELIDAARVFSSAPIPSGNGIAVLSGQAGPSMAGTDKAILYGMEIVRLKN